MTRSTYSALQIQKMVEDEGKSVKEVMAITGYTRSGVYKALQRARKVQRPTPPLRAV